MPDDLATLQRLGSRTWSPTSGGCRHHPGQLAWSARSVEGADSVRTRVLEEHGGVAGWAWVEGDHLDLCVDVADLHVVDVAREAVAWSLEQTSDDAPSATMVLADEHLLLDVLTEAGFLREDGPYFRHHHLDLSRLPSVPEVRGYRLKPVQQGDAAPRAACHRAAWSAPDRPSRVTTTSYAAVMATSPYRPDLDWVAVGADGAWVASCLAWLDPETGVALLEPVGCAPDHRRRGLARAVSLAALHAARDAGATRALVCPRGDRDYPGPAALYQGLGFEPGERTLTLVREP